MPDERRSDLRRIAGSAGLAAAGKAATLALGLVSIAVTTRYLGPEGYGKVALAFSVVGIFAAVADAGVTTIVVRELASRPERAAVVVGSALALRSGLCLAALAGAGVLAVALPYEPDVRVAIVIAGVPMAFGLFTSAFTAVLLAGLRGGRVAIADVAGRLASLAAVGAVALLDLGFQAVVATAGVGAAVSFAVTVGLARTALAGRPRRDPEVSRSLLRAALPVGAALAINEVYFRADALIISVSRSYEELGRYAVAWRLSELAAVFPGVVLLSVFPVLSRYVADRDPRLRPGLQAAFDAFCLLGAGIAAGGVVVAEALAEALGGEAFAPAAGPLRILLCAAALGCVSGLLGNALIARGMQARALWLNGAALVVNVALNVALVPGWGILAAAWIALACEVGLLAGSAWLVKRAFGFAPSPAALARIAPAAACMAGVLWPVRHGPVWLTIPLGALVFLASARVLGALDPARLRSLARQ